MRFFKRDVRPTENGGHKPRRELSVSLVARTGAVVITIASMAILYYGLYGLAREAGYTSWQSALFPSVVDGVVFVAYLSAYVFRNGWHRAYAWSVVVVCVGVSALGQYLHTQSLVGTLLHGVPNVPGKPLRTVPDWAPWVAVIPSLASAVALHLAVTLFRVGRATDAPPSPVTVGQAMDHRATKAPEACQQPEASGPEAIEDAVIVPPAELTEAPPVRVPAPARALETARPGIPISLVKKGPASAVASVPVPEAREGGAPVRPRAGRRALDVPDDAIPIMRQVMSGELAVSDAARWAIANGHTTSEDIGNARKLVRRWRAKVETSDMLTGEIDASEVADAQDDATVSRET